MLDSCMGSSQVRVVVPPRSYFQKTKERPLAGTRLVVKDNFDIKGFKTSLCNRAWRELYPTPEKTAPCIQRLVELGAVIVAKAKLQAMIVREDTMETVDFLAPFNPRGDRYQTSSGSSDGSCAAIGSYPWLDFAIGSDTNGSGQKPSQWNGCFAIRPTFDAIPLEGVVGYFAFYNMPVFFSRDLADFSYFAQCWYGDSAVLKESEKLPQTILYPSDHLTTSSKAQMALMDYFVESLESLLGVKRKVVNLVEMWAEHPPRGVEEKYITIFLKDAGWLPFYHDLYEKTKGFRDSYRTKIHKFPFIHEHLRWRCEISKGLKKEDRDEQFNRLLIHKKWLRETVFKTTEKHNPGVIMVLPIEDGMPNYRERPPMPYELPSALSPLYISATAGIPEVTAPIGEIPFQCTVTQKMEPLPIAVSVAGAPGTDIMLIDLVKKALERDGNATKLSTGRSMFEGPSSSS